MSKGRRSEPETYLEKALQHKLIIRSAARGTVTFQHYGPARHCPKCIKERSATPCVENWWTETSLTSFGWTDVSGFGIIVLCLVAFAVTLYVIRHM